MSESAVSTIRVQIGGQSLSNSITRSEEQSSVITVDMAAAKAGTLSTRTDDNTGILTVASGHGITTSDLVTVFWNGGLRSGMTVTGTTSTTISIDAGAGDNLPTASTVITVSIQSSNSAVIDGDSLVTYIATCTNRVHVNFVDGSSGSIVAYDIPAGEGRYFATGMGLTNALAGETVETIKVSNGSASTASFKFGFLRSTN